MSQPFPGTALVVVADAVEALAGELATLAAELTEDVQRTRCAAVSFPEALEGPEGRLAGAAALSWACLYDVIASRTRALARTLTETVAAYLAEDTAIAGALGHRRPPR